MTVAVKIQLKGYNKIAETFKKAPARMTRELGIAIKSVVEKLENDAKREAPVNKQSGGGNLRQSIRGRMTGAASGKIEVGVGYGVFVHEGTKPHTIRVSRRRVLANRRTGNIFGKVVKHPGTKANPFLTRAVEKNEKFINRQFALAVQRALS